MIKKRKLKMWLGVMISLLAVFIVLRKLQWADFFESVSHVKSIYIFYATLFMVLNLLVRAKRWQILLRPFSRVRLLRDSFTFYTIGYMANMLLAFKPGEILRPYLLGKKLGIAKTPLLMTVVIERLWDISFLAVLFLITLTVSMKNIPLVVRQVILLGGAMAGFVMVVLWVLLMNHWMKTKIGFLFRWLPETLSKRLKMFIDLSFLGIQSLGDIWSALSIFLLTCGVYLCSFFIINLCLRAFGLDLSWYVIVFVIVIVNFGMVIPSSPGAIGVAHALYVFSLSLFDVSKNEAFGVAVLVHGICFLTVVFCGLISLWQEGLSFAQVRSEIPRGGSDSMLVSGESD